MASTSVVPTQGPRGGCRGLSARHLQPGPLRTNSRGGIDGDFRRLQSAEWLRRCVHTDHRRPSLALEAVAKPRAVAPDSPQPQPAGDPTSTTPARMAAVAYADFGLKAPDEGVPDTQDAAKATRMLVR